MLVQCIPSSPSLNAITFGFPGIHGAAELFSFIFIFFGVAMLRYSPTFERWHEAEASSALKNK